jgi:hypothetical protein
MPELIHNIRIAQQPYFTIGSFHVAYLRLELISWLPVAAKCWKIIVRSSSYLRVRGGGRGRPCADRIGCRRDGAAKRDTHGVSITNMLCGLSGGRPCSSIPRCWLTKPKPKPVACSRASGNDHACNRGITGKSCASSRRVFDVYCKTHGSFTSCYHLIAISWSASALGAARAWR